MPERRDAEPQQSCSRSALSSNSSLYPRSPSCSGSSPATRRSASPSATCSYPGRSHLPPSTPCSCSHRLSSSGPHRSCDTDACAHRTWESCPENVSFQACQQALRRCCGPRTFQAVPLSPCRTRLSCAGTSLYSSKRLRQLEDVFLSPMASQRLRYLLLVRLYPGIPQLGQLARLPFTT